MNFCGNAVRAEEQDDPVAYGRTEALERAAHGVGHRVEVERIVRVRRDAGHREAVLASRHREVRAASSFSDDPVVALRVVREQRERDDALDRLGRHGLERVSRRWLPVAHRDERLARARTGAVQAGFERARPARG